MSISTIRVTFQASRSVVGNVLLIMLFVHFRPVMAAEACPRLGARGMAASTITIGITIIHGKIMIERGTLPGGCVMTLRALTLEVVGWSFVLVAIYTICRPNRLVVESTAAPPRSVMALRALTIKVVGRFVIHMACCTVRRPNHLVVKSTAAPPRSIMALRALTLKVVGRSCHSYGMLYSPSPQPPGG